MVDGCDRPRADDGGAPSTDRFWRIHHDPLRRFCAALVGADDADDLAAEPMIEGSPDDEQQPATISTQAPGPNEPLALGDTVMSGAAAELSARGYRVDAEANRQLPDVVPLLRQLREDGLLGDPVVVHLGNNGPVTAAQLDAVLTELADVPNVLLLNVAVDRPWTDANNQLLTERDTLSDNIVLIDWANRSADCVGDCFAPDGIHLAADGVRFYADIIGDWTGR